MKRLKDDVNMVLLHTHQPSPETAAKMTRIKAGRLSSIMKLLFLLKFIDQVTKVVTKKGTKYLSKLQPVMSAEEPTGSITPDPIGETSDFMGVPYEESEPERGFDTSRDYEGEEPRKKKKKKE